MEKVVPVKITKDELACHAQIIRSMLAATTAAMRLGDAELIAMCNVMRKQAEDRYDKLVKKEVNELSESC